MESGLGSFQRKPADEEIKAASTGGLLLLNSLICRRQCPHLMCPNLRNRDHKSCGYPDRLLMPPAECVAVSGLDEPAKLAVFRGPDHPLQGKLTGSLRPAARRGVTQLRSRSDHELDMLVDRERLQIPGSDDGQRRWHFAPNLSRVIQQEESVFTEERHAVAVTRSTIALKAS